MEHGSGSAAKKITGGRHNEADRCNEGGGAIRNERKRNGAGRWRFFLGAQETVDFVRIPVRDR